MASCLVYISRFLFFVSVSLQAYSLASYPAKYKHKQFLWIVRPVPFCNCSKALHHFRPQELTAVIWCLDVLHRWFRNFGGDEPIEDNFGKAYL